MCCGFGLALSDDFLVKKEFVSTEKVDFTEQEQVFLTMKQGNSFKLPNPQAVPSLDSAA